MDCFTSHVGFLVMFECVCVCVEGEEGCRSELFDSAPCSSVVLNLWARSHWRGP